MRSYSPIPVHCPNWASRKWQWSQTTWSRALLAASIPWKWRLPPLDIIRQNEPIENAGSHQCKNEYPRGCHSCPIVAESKTFSSTNTKKTYKIRQNLNCKSSFVIYLGTCKKCKGQYVGKSKNEFRVRHSGHKQQIKNNVGGIDQLYHQENGCGYQYLSIVLIEKVENGNEAKLCDRELYWQHQLRAFRENGGNAHCVKNETES